MLEKSKSTSVFACVQVCVGCVEGSMELGIYKRRVELMVLVCRVVISFTNNSRLIDKCQ